MNNKYFDANLFEELRRTTSTRRCSSTPPASRATSWSMRPTPTTLAA